MRHFIFLSTLLTIPFFAISQGSHEQPGAIGITASLPWVNNYSYYDYDQKNSSSRSGFVGLGASVFYKTSKNKFSLNFGFTGDLPAPMGTFDYRKEGTRTNILSNFWEGLYHRRLLDKLKVITGFNYVKYRFNFSSYVNTLPSYSTSDRTLGITAGSEYQFSKTFSVALLYRPTIISLDLKQYRHVISLDARFDIDVWRRK